MTTKPITANEMTLAIYYARQAVKAKWKAQGKRYCQIDASELMRAARDWLSKS